MRNQLRISNDEEEAEDLLESLRDASLNRSLHSLRPVELTLLVSTRSRRRRYLMEDRGGTGETPTVLYRILLLNNCVN